MQCPRCGGATQQGPGGSWLCPNCGWSTGYDPGPAIAWLERQPITAHVGDEDAPTWRRAMFDEDSDWRGGAVGQLYSVKEDHEANTRVACRWCRIALEADSLMVVG